MPEAIVDMSFSQDGSALAYAAAYDYGNGKITRQTSARVFVKIVPTAEMAPKN